MAVLRCRDRCTVAQRTADSFESRSTGGLPDVHSFWSPDANDNNPGLTLVAGHH